MPNSVAVAGVGLTRFGHLPGNSAYDLGAWALREALADCGLNHKDLDGLIVCRIPDYQRMGEMLGKRKPTPTFRRGLELSRLRAVVVLSRMWWNRVAA